MRFVGAQLVHQATPAIPLGVGSKIRTDVRIDVSVDIDSTGKPTGAHVVSAKGEAAGLLAFEALKAARLSRFLPARQNDAPVASQAVITFVFAPGRY